MTEIKCFACMKAGDKLVPWAYAVPSNVPDNEVEVQIMFCGLCHSDLHQINDAWGAASFPLVPGHEIVGKVVKVGKSVTSFAEGDVVGIGVQRSSCRECIQCKAGREHTCSKITKTYAGPKNDKGGYAEKIRYPADWVFKIPDGLSPAEAAPLLCAGITTFSPLKRWVKKEKSVVAIIGLGGLGHIALQIAAKMPSVEKVIAVSTSESKKNEALGFGAHEFVVSKDPSQMKAVAGTVDVVLNTVSGNTDLDVYLSLVKVDGIMVCVGLPPKEKKVGLFLQSIVPLEKQICGSYLGPKQDYEEMLQFCADNNVKPAIKLFAASDVNTAMAELDANTLRYRAVLDFK